MDQFEVGQLYMFAAGEGWMFVGRFVRPAGALGGVFTDVVNLARTNGVPWADLVAGKRRKTATYVAFPPEEVPFPIIRFGFKWAGDLPASTA